MTELDLSPFDFRVPGGPASMDPHHLPQQDKKGLLMAGFDATEKQRSGTFMHLDQGQAYCHSSHPDVELLDIKEALLRYNGLPDYFWQLIEPHQDPFTRLVDERLQGGYFIRVAPGAKIPDPVQSCLFMKGERVGQAIHNIIIVEEGAEVHIITGCAIAAQERSGAHIGVSEFYVRKGGRLTYTMIHNWGEQVDVRARSRAVVEEGGVFESNYILLRPVKSLQMYPTIDLNGAGAVSRSNSIIIAPPGCRVDCGTRMNLNGPHTKGEIISRAISTGGTLFARGHIRGNTVPCRGHLECKGLILGDGSIHAIPELEGCVEGVELSHEAAVGKIAQEEIEYLMARGLDEDEATAVIVQGFLNVDIMGLPPQLKAALDQVIDECRREML
jgi:Fe-S cluster assembly scaffold protein SufB